MTFIILNADGDIVNRIESEETFVSNYCSSHGYTYVPIESNETILMNKNLREQAYETDEIIPYEDAFITVDKANQLYLQYLAEGDNIRVAELTSLIATAKAAIREKYPDQVD